MDRLSLMQTFITVIEAGSFSGAAKRLHVGQPSVSKSIAQLEEYLGVRLLLRSPRGLTPTEAGRNYYEGALRALDDFAEIERVARGAGANLLGRLKICAPVTFARLHIIPFLSAFLAGHPDISVEVVLDDRNIDLLEAGIDVALRMGPLDASTMTARRLAKRRRVVVGTPTYLALAGEPLIPSDLTAHQTIIYERDGGGEPWRFRNGGSEMAIAVGGRLHVTAAEGVRAAVLSDIGLAVVSEWMFAPELASGAVKAVLQDWALPSVDLWAVFPSGRKASAKARAFVAFVEDVMRRDPSVSAQDIHIESKHVDNDSTVPQLA